jgi:hypothetical protein
MAGSTSYMRRVRFGGVLQEYYLALLAGCVGIGIGSGLIKDIEKFICCRCAHPTALVVGGTSHIHSARLRP